MFALVAFRWGIPYLLISVALTGFDATFVAWTRVALAPLGLALILAGSWLASRAGSGARVEPAPPRRSRTGQAQRAAAT
jgi:hypothetical protein